MKSRCTFTVEVRIGEETIDLKRWAQQYAAALVRVSETDSQAPNERTPHADPEGG